MRGPYSPEVTGRCLLEMDPEESDEVWGTDSRRTGDGGQGERRGEFGFDESLGALERFGDDLRLARAENKLPYRSNPQSVPEEFDLGFVSRGGQREPQANEFAHSP